MKSSVKLKTGCLALSFIFITGCSSTPKTETVDTAATQTQTQTEAPAKTVEAPSPIQTEIQKIAALAEEQHSKSTHGGEEPKIELVPAKSDHDAHKDHHKIEGTDPEKAFGWLKNGNTRFVKQRLRNDGQSPQDVKRLSEGQKPHSIVLSCSDSRVPPELVFDQKLGEIFVVRTAGQTLDPVALASIEYAVEHLGASNIVVLGHTKCGAVKAAHSTLHGEDAGSVNLNHLVKDIHPRIEAYKDKKPSQDYTEESWANVDGVATDLLKRSVLLEQKASRGSIKVRRGLYDLHSGKVDFK